jgi:hypothetical protein
MIFIKKKKKEKEKRVDAFVACSLRLKINEYLYWRNCIDTLAHNSMLLHGVVTTLIMTSNSSTVTEKFLTPRTWKLRTK